MMSEHTASHNLALRMIGDERQAILLRWLRRSRYAGGRLKASRRARRSF